MKNSTQNKNESPPFMKNEIKVLYAGIGIVVFFIIWLYYIVFQHMLKGKYFFEGGVWVGLVIIVLMFIGFIAAIFLV